MSRAVIAESPAAGDVKAEEVLFKHSTDQRGAPLLAAKSSNAVFEERRPRTFTLVELLVVVAIIGLLAALSLPVLSRVKAKAKMAKCVGNLHQIGVRLHSYTDDYNGFLPVCERIGDTPSDPNAIQNVMPMPSAEVYHCPADNVPRFSGKTFFGKHGSSYEWNAWFNGMTLATSKRLRDILGNLPVVWDSAQYHEKLGHNFLYLDGEVKTE